MGIMLWTKQEVAILRKHYATDGSKGCQRRLPGRTIKQISSKAGALGIKLLASQTDEVGAALAVLARMVPRNSRLEQDIIADICGCSRQYIHQLEVSAIAKLRHSPTLRTLADECEK